MANIVNQEYWNDKFKSISFEKIGNDDQVRKCIETYIPKTDVGTAIEIGCYPGRFLGIFGELGYELHGMDLNPDVLLIAEILKKEGFKVGNIGHEDFLKVKSNTYDVVSSFGFIEHFTNLEEILLKHMEMVKSGGFLVLESPNFNGWVQYLFHYLFDTPNLKRHVRRNMDPFLWKSIIEKSRFDFEIKSCGYLGGIDFWTDNDQPLVQNFFAKIVKRFWRLVRKIYNFDRVNSKSVSIGCILIARKNDI